MSTSKEALMIVYSAPTPRQTRPKRTELNPRRIAAAFAGQVEAKALTTAERRTVVRYLAVVECLSDVQIAVLLRWAPGKTPAEAAKPVSVFRRNWDIPSGSKLARHAPIRMDKVIAAITGQLTKDDLRPAELRAVVRHLAVRMHLADTQIAVRLNWLPDKPLPRRAYNVAVYRNRWDIAAATPAQTTAPTPRELVKAA